jgi:hypothetical protein
MNSYTGLITQTHTTLKGWEPELSSLTSSGPGVQHLWSTQPWIMSICECGQHFSDGRNLAQTSKVQIWDWKPARPVAFQNSKFPMCLQKQRVKERGKKHHISARSRESAVEGRRGGVFRLHVTLCSWLTALWQIHNLILRYKPSGTRATTIIQS